MRHALRKLLAPAANYAARRLAEAGRPLHTSGRRVGGDGSASVNELVDRHFRTHSSIEHVNFESMRDTLRLLGGRSATILETGSSAWGTNSSQLFDSYVAAFGGEFCTVDIRLGPLRTLMAKLGTQSTLVCDDSVRFLERWLDEHPDRKVDLVYLDSYDVDFSSPVPAALHGLRELWAIRPALRDGSLLLVDDTPASIEWLPPAERAAAEAFQAEHGLVPGKGMLVDACLRASPHVTLVHHRYQALYRFGAERSG